MVAKQPKKKRPPKRTVEQNLSNLNSAESERKCEVGGRSFRRSSSSAARDQSALTHSLTHSWSIFPKMNYLEALNMR